MALKDDIKNLKESISGDILALKQLMENAQMNQSS